MFKDLGQTQQKAKDTEIWVQVEPGARELTGMTPVWAWRGGMHG